MFEKALSFHPKITWETRYDPTGPLEGVRALSFEGMPLHGAPTRVFAYYGAPKNAQKSPGVVLTHGGGGHAFCGWVKRWVDRGFAALAVDTVGYFPKYVNAGAEEGFGALWTRAPEGEFLLPGEVCGPDNSEMRDAGEPIENQWMYHAVSDVILANTILRSFPEADENRVGLTGISWGGVISSLVIGYDARFAFAVPVYGSGYLAPSLASIAPMFRTEAADRLWRAETRFDRVKTPVLWSCWNEDVAFSLEANTKSYLDTRAGNPLTALSALYDMRHSHAASWLRDEPYLYAQAVCGMRDPLPTVTETRTGGAVRAHVENDADTKLRLFWLDKKMTYSVHESRFDGVRLSQDQAWHYRDMQKDAPTELPAGAKAYYVEAKSVIDGREYVVSTPYTEL